MGLSNSRTAKPFVEDLVPLLRTLYGGSQLLTWLINLCCKPIHHCPPIDSSTCLNYFRYPLVKDAIVWPTYKFQSLFAVSTNLRHDPLRLMTDCTGDVTIK